MLCQPCNGAKGANGEISEKRKTIIHIRQPCAHLTSSKKRLSMAEIAHTSDVSYHFVLEYEDAIRRELKLPPNLKKYPYLASKQHEAGKDESYHLSACPDKRSGPPIVMANMCIPSSGQVCCTAATSGLNLPDAPLSYADSARSMALPLIS